METQKDRDELFRKIAKELAVTRFVCKTLLRFPPNERRRLLAYLWDKYVRNPDPPPERA